MSKCSTIHQLVMADIRESNARNKKSRNQKNWYGGVGFLKAMFQASKKHYRRDRILRRLCDLNMKKLVKEMTK